MEIVTGGILDGSKPRARARIRNGIRKRALRAKAAPHKIRDDGIDAEAGAWVEERLPGWVR